MLSQIGASISGGDMDAKTQELCENLIKAFEIELIKIVDENRIPHRKVRPTTPGSVVCGIIDNTIYVGYNPHLGMPSKMFINLRSDGQHDSVAFYDFVRDRLGVDFCVVSLDADWVESASRTKMLREAAIDLVSRELNRRSNEAAIMSNQPLFGPNKYPIQESLVFVLMPFDEELKEIYELFVKKKIEDKGLVCRRADEIQSNGAIIADIWKSICESRFIVADITKLNPNVMYELGIAHAIGKETILINQEGSSNRYPFDISHIRILNYKNTASGGNTLSEKLGAAIDSVLSKITADKIAN